MALARTSPSSLDPTPSTGRPAPPSRDLTLAYDYFKKGSVSSILETVNADAWILGARDEEVVEHVFVMPSYGMAMSLLWFPAK